MIHFLKVLSFKNCTIPGTTSRSNNFSFSPNPLPDTLTLQLWRDRREHSRGGPATKGSVALSGYLGCETGFALDRESLTLGLVLRDQQQQPGGGILTLALDSREALVRWQVSCLVGRWNKKKKKRKEEKKNKKQATVCANKN